MNPSIISAPPTAKNGANFSNGQSPPVKSMRGKYKTIMINTLIVVFPLLLICIILLCLVFHYRVRHNVLFGGRLQSVGTKDESGVIYVNINPTYLMKVASLSSTIATSLASFAVILAAYPLAVDILRQTQGLNYYKLLTPYQYYLALGLVESASIPAIYRWLMYTRRQGDQKVNQPRPMVIVGGTVVITFILGGLVFAAETWFHFGTKPYTFTQVSPAAGYYSNALSVNCTISDNSYDAQLQYPCSIRPDIRGGTLVNPLPSLEVLGNVSETLSVNIFQGMSPPHAFLGIPGNGAVVKQDFEANTYSVSTKCTPVMKECGLSRDSLTSGASVPFTCPQYPGFSGNLLDPNPIELRYFSDASGSENSTDDIPGNVALNPFFFGINGHTDRAAGVSDGLMNDPEVVALEYGGIAYIFFCNTTVFDSSYLAVNGSIEYFNAAPSNLSVTKMIQIATTVTGTGYNSLVQAANLGALSSTAEEMADSVSTVFSQAMLALVAGAMQPDLALLVQQRSEFIVSRVPTGALILLVAAIFLMVAWGCFLAVVALVTAKTKDVEEVRVRLSMQNLVAEKLEPDRVHMPVESLSEIFEENAGVVRKRVGIGKCEGVMGGWEVKVRSQSQGSK